MEKQLADDIRFINKFLYCVQPNRIALGNWIDAKKRDGINPSVRAEKLFKDIKAQEKDAVKMAMAIVKKSPIWDEFFENIKGIGPCLSTSLMAEIRDIGRFDTISALWAYIGLIAEYYKLECTKKGKKHNLIMSSNKHKTCQVFKNKKKELCNTPLKVIEKITGKSPKRETGYHYFFNSRLKMICWKVAGQLVKQGDPFYRGIYDKAKILYQNKAKADGLEIISATEISDKEDKTKYISKDHVDNRAKRKLVKIFISHLWEAWRLSENMAIRKPYVIEKMGHTGYISWKDTKKRLIEDREDAKNKKVNWEKPQRGERYVIGADIAEDDSVDYCRDSYAIRI